MKLLIISLSLISTSLVFGESLWLSKSNSETSIYSDRIAANVGDILTIMVDESSSLSSSLSKSTNETGQINAGITDFFYSGLGTIDGEYPSVQVNGPGSTHTGGGNVTNIQNVTSSASVLVVDKLPNGNLMIEGARELVLAGETQYIVIRGVVRRDDISEANTVMSSKIAGAQIEFLEKGAIASAQKQGWIARLLNVANVW